MTSEPAGVGARSAECCVRNVFFTEAFLFYVSLESRLAFLFGCSVLEIFVGVSE